MNNDLISRETLKEDLRRFFPAEVLEGIEPKTLFAQILHDIDNASAVDISKEVWNQSNALLEKRLTYLGRPQGEWIPVSERLPEKMGTYLVTLEYKEYGKGITTLWYHGKGIGWDLRVANEVIAWQPLPEPYMRGKEE